ncbi:MAG: insulinase family protein [Anaerolineae bacterium]|nr:insulinase family protein [Anaerolineae bacterium]
MSIPGPDDVKRYELSNGLVLLVRQNHASPSVVISGYLPVAARDEPAEQAGLSAFTADALSRGTMHRSFSQIYEAVEAVGASFGFSSGRHFTGFGAKSLVEDLPLTLDVLSDVLRNPTFPKNEVEKLRGEILTDLEERAHDTRDMAGLTFNTLAYPAAHPHSRSVSGYIETVSALTRDDVVAFYRRGYGPQGMVLTLVGAVEPEQALARVEDAFGDWSGASPVRDPLPPALPLTEVRREDVAIPGKTQSDLIMGAPGPARTDPHFLDALLCNTILGVFGIMGRLGETVREQQGLAYYVYSRVTGGVGPGPWTMIAGVNPANVERAVESIRAEVRRIQQEPVPADELADNKAFIVGSLPLRLETNEGVASALLDMERYGLGLDYLRRYRGLIEAITPERVQAAAQRWLDPDAYALAVAGPPRE